MSTKEPKVVTTQGKGEMKQGRTTVMSEPKPAVNNKGKHVPSRLSPRKVKW
jgi:hypothetical protein